MDEQTQAIPQTEAPVATPGQVADQSQDTAQRTFVPFPTDKLRELNRKAADYDRLQREGQTTSQTTSAPPLPPDAQQAVDMIAEASARKVSGEMGDVREELDSIRFDKNLAALENDANAKYLKDEIVTEYAAQLERNPKAKKSDLLEKAQNDAILKAARNGTLMARIAQEAVDAYQTAQADRRSSSAPAGKAAPADQGPKDYAKMTPQEISQLDESEFNAAMVSMTGGLSRRRR